MKRTTCNLLLIFVLTVFVVDLTKADRKRRTVGVEGAADAYAVHVNEAADSAASGIVASGLAIADKAKTLLEQDVEVISQSIINSELASATDAEITSSAVVKDVDQIAETVHCLSGADAIAEAIQKIECLGDVVETSLCEAKQVICCATTTIADVVVSAGSKIQNAVENGASNVTAILNAYEDKVVCETRDGYCKIAETIQDYMGAIVKDKENSADLFVDATNEGIKQATSDLRQGQTTIVKNNGIAAQKLSNNIADVYLGLQKSHLKLLHYY